MDDDFNTREAISVLFEMAREVNRLKRDTDPQAAVLASQMRGLGNILGLLELDPQAYLKVRRVRAILLMQILMLL